MRLLTLVLIAVSLVVLFGSESFAQAKLWYYCRTTHQFYPYTQRCSVPWRAVKPYKVTPLKNSPRNPLPASGAGFDDTLNPGCAGLGLTTPHDPKCLTPAPQS